MSVRLPMSAENGGRLVPPIDRNGIGDYDCNGAPALWNFTSKSEHLTNLNLSLIILAAGAASSLNSSCRYMPVHSIIFNIPDKTYA